MLFDLNNFFISHKIRIVLLSFFISINVNASEIEFDSDLLDIDQRKNINLSLFSTPGKLVPGKYNFNVYINGASLGEKEVFYYASSDSDSSICITNELVDAFGLKSEYYDNLTWWHDDQCLDLNSLSGIKTQTDLGRFELHISIPQAYVEYLSDNWDPPALWEDGIAGFLFDYNVNAQASQQKKPSKNTIYNTYGNGTTGANLGAWRFRADWQTYINKMQGQNSQRNFEWARYYAFRIIKSLNAKLTLGETYSYSDIFETFRFTGASLITDENMLPPSFRGYAPEITGIAKSNATVIVSKNGYVIYQTQVSAGPFRIQNLNDSISGELDVTVEEQDGGTQSFTVSTATIPHLTRQGQIRYKFSGGKPSDYQHNINNNPFISSEFSWGISNNWSFYGGGEVTDNYHSIAMGIGRNLMRFGAISFDTTYANTQLNNKSGINSKRQQSFLYRLNYTKHFDDYDSQLSLSSYRYADADFMSMAEYFDSIGRNTNSFGNKEMYSVSYFQQFTKLGLGSSLNFNRTTYWNRAATERYSLSFSKYFNLNNIKNLSLNLMAFRSVNESMNDDGVYLSLSIPWGNGDSVSLSSNMNKDSTSNQVSYNGRIDQQTNYTISTGWEREGNTLGGSYQYSGSYGTFDSNVTYEHNRYHSAGLGLSGGLTITQEGMSLHRISQAGGTRMFISTSGVADISLEGLGAPVYTNIFGHAVISDVSSYYRSQIHVNVNKLPEKASLNRSTTQGTLTEGAIGYRQFDVMSGSNAMAVVRFADNQFPPLGSTVKNSLNQQVGIIADDGNVYLIGLKANDVLVVEWDKGGTCKIQLPEILPDEDSLLTNWLLPCLKN
ncbi:outer membrane usher protein [Providencia sp.]